MNHREAASFYVLVKKKRGSKGNRSYSFRNFAGEFIITLFLRFMNSALPTTRRQRIWREMKDYLLIALGMIMYGIGWNSRHRHISHQLPVRIYQQCIACFHIIQFKYTF